MSVNGIRNHFIPFCKKVKISKQQNKFPQNLFIARGLVNV
jgi:hypothetical protein